MSRIPYVEINDHPELKELTELISKVHGGRITNLQRVLLNSPPVSTGWQHFLSAIRKQTVLPAIYRELVILHVAVLNGAKYEYKGHMHLALQAGVTQQQADDLATWHNSTAYDERMRAILDYCETMTRDIDVPDAVFERVNAMFNAREMLELTAMIATYNLVSRMLVALRIQ